MRIFKIAFDAEKYRKLGPLYEYDLEGDNLWVTGALKLPSWRAPKMEYSTPEDNQAVADVTQISTAFYAYNARALAVLGEVLEGSGELLELPVINGELVYAFNPRNEIDCLDDASEWKINRVGKKKRLIRPVFDKSQLEGVPVFQVPELVKSTLFVTDLFIEKYMAGGLSGLVFEEC